MKMRVHYLGLFFLALLISAEAITIRERINTVLFQKHNSRVQEIFSRAMERLENGGNIDDRLNELERIGHGLSDRMVQTLEIHAVHRLTSTLGLPVFAELGPVPPRILSGKDIERHRGEITIFLEKAEFFWGGEEPKCSKGDHLGRVATCSTKSDCKSNPNNPCEGECVCDDNGVNKCTCLDGEKLEQFKEDMERKEKKWQAIKNMATRVGSSVKEATQTVVKKTKTKIGKVVEKAMDIVEDPIGFTKDAAKKLQHKWENAKDNFERLKKLNVMDKVKQIPWSKIWLALKFSLKSLVHWGWNLVKKIIRPFQLILQLFRGAMYVLDGYMLGSLGPIIKDFQGDKCSLPPNMANLTTRLSGVLKDGLGDGSVEGIKPFSIKWFTKLIFDKEFRGRLTQTLKTMLGLVRDAISAVGEFVTNCEGFKTLGKTLLMVAGMFVAMLAVASIPVVGPIIIFVFSAYVLITGIGDTVKYVANKGQGIYIDANCPFKSPCLVPCPSARTLYECFGDKYKMCQEQLSGIYDIENTGDAKANTRMLERFQHERRCRHSEKTGSILNPGPESGPERAVEFLGNILGSILGLKGDIMSAGELKVESKVVWFNIRKKVKLKSGNKVKYDKKKVQQVRDDMVTNSKAVKDLELPKKKVDGLLNHVDKTGKEFLKKHPGLTKASPEYQKHVRKEYHKYLKKHFDPQDAQKLNLKSKSGKRFEKEVVNADMLSSRYADLKKMGFTTKELKKMNPDELLNMLGKYDTKIAKEKMARNPFSLLGDFNDHLTYAQKIETATSFMKRCGRIVFINVLLQQFVYEPEKIKDRIDSGEAEEPFLNADGTIVHDGKELQLLRAFAAQLFAARMVGIEMVSASDSTPLTLDYGSFATLPFGKGRMALTYNEHVDGATLDDAREERRRIMISLGLRDIETKMLGGTSFTSSSKMNEVFVAFEDKPDSDFVEDLKTQLAQYGTTKCSEDELIQTDEEELSSTFGCTFQFVCTEENDSLCGGDDRTFQTSDAKLTIAYYENGAPKSFELITNGIRNKISDVNYGILPSAPGGACVEGSSPTGVYDRESICVPKVGCALRGGEIIDGGECVQFVDAKEHPTFPMKCCKQSLRRRRLWNKWSRRSTGDS